MANYQNKFSASLTTDILAGATSSQLSELPTIDAPFSMAFDANDLNGKYEIVEILAKTSSGVSHAGTTYDHTTLEKVKIVFPATVIDSLSTSIAALSGTTLASGIVRPYAGSTAPTGWVLCDGTSYLRTGTYANLFTAIGTTYGAADGTHFNVPDTRAKVVMGFDSGDAAFDALGETGGSLTVNVEHSHTGGSHTHTASGTSATNSAATTMSDQTGTGHALSPHTHTYSVTTAAGAAAGSTNGGSTTQSILMPYLTLNLIIKL